jgi:hypothetical protein
VTVNVLSGAGLDVTDNNGIVEYDRSTVTNLGTVQVTGNGFTGVSAQGTGAGLDVLVNQGTITTNGDQSIGLYNSAAAVSMLNDKTGFIMTSGTNARAMATSPQQAEVC